MSFPQPDQQCISINGDEFVLYISRDRIQQRVRELAGELTRALDGKQPIFLCVLNGAFMFYADLIRHITIDCEVDFIKLSSYGERKISSGKVELVKDLSCDVAGRHIVIIEDIVDTGFSIDYMKKWIGEKHPASLSIVTLLHKPASTKIQHTLDYIGFSIPPDFVIGYGLDYAQKARNLPEIFIHADSNGLAGKKR